MTLLIVESPGKVKTIEKYLGSDYVVMASVGHIRDITKANPGFDTKTFQPRWEMKAGAEERIEQINQLSAKADSILLATDPDREGEAIAWHLWDIIDKKYQSKCKRITFNEITKEAITSAIKEPRDINMDEVYSQWARRILDRFIGYDLSRLVKNKLKADSAGRVQSVALLFVVERAKQVEAFIPEPWWTIDTKLKGNFPIYLRNDATFDNIKTKNMDPYEYTFNSEDDAKKAIDMIAKLGNEYELYNIEPKQEKIGKTIQPFKTDTLLTKAINTFGWSNDEVTKLAQVMYEGVTINNESVSLTTYPRTDINRLNEGFIKNTKDYIAKTYGQEYVGEKNLSFNNGPMVQGAHEGIRPVDITITPEWLKDNINLSKEESKKTSADKICKLYTLIWSQTIASLMKPPTTKSTEFRFKIAKGKEEYKFYTSNSITTFQGYKIIPWFNKKEEIDLSYLKIGDILKPISGPEVGYHETKTDPYFTEASLIQQLDKDKIGRPSTYGTMLKVIKGRDYIIPASELPEGHKKELRPTPLGVRLIDSLSQHFSKFISKVFTAQMEESLSVIADGNIKYQEWLKNIYDDFKQVMSDAKTNLVKTPDEIVEGRKCPLCGKDLVYKQGRNGKFIGCSGWAAKNKGCNFTESLVAKEPTPSKILDEDCPMCGKKLTERYSKNGTFVGCSGYPTCRYIRKELVGRKCPKCGKDLVYCKGKGKKSTRFIGCEGYSKKDKNGCDYREDIK